MIGKIKLNEDYAMEQVHVGWHIFAYFEDEGTIHQDQQAGSIVLDADGMMSAIRLVVATCGRVLGKRREMTIPIADHVENIQRLRAYRDGNAFFVAFDDFVNLQESPVYFIGNEYRGHIEETLRKWYGLVPDPLVHLSHGERCYLSRKVLAAAKITEAAAPRKAVAIAVGKETRKP